MQKFRAVSLPLCRLTFQRVLFIVILIYIGTARSTSLESKYVRKTGQLPVVTGASQNTFVSRSLLAIALREKIMLTLAPRTTRRNAAVPRG